MSPSLGQAHGANSSLYFPEKRLTFSSAACVRVQCRYWTRSRDPNCESERYSLYKYWAKFSCFFKEQPLNLVRCDRTHFNCFNVQLRASLATSCFLSTGSTTARRLAFISPGWVSTPRCCSLLPSSAVCASSTASSHTMTTSGGDFTALLNLLSGLFYSRCPDYHRLRSPIRLTARKSVTSRLEETLSCVHCVTGSAVTGNSIQLATPPG